MTLEKRIWLWDLIVLTLLAAGLRFHHLEALSFSTPEAENALVARTYLETGRFELPSGQIRSNGLSYRWIETQLFRAFGESEWIARLPAAICGVFTTGLLYLWGSHWLGAWTGRWAALFYAVWPWSISWGRTAQAENLQQLIYFLLILSIWKLLERNRLGAPIVDPPLARGPRTSTLVELARLSPTLILLALSVLTGFLSVVSFVFIPLYLAIRLGWSWRRGGAEDAAFERTKNSLFALLGVFGVAAGTLYLLHPQLIQAALVVSGSDPGFYLRFLHGSYGLVFILLFGTGLLSLLTRGLAGWLIFSSIAGPLVVYSFFFQSHQPRYIYNLFPSICLAIGYVLGWASLKVEGFLDAFSVRPKPPKLAEFSGFLLLIVGVVPLVHNVFTKEGSSADILAGRRSAITGEVADFRGLADWARPYAEEAVIVSMDPILSDYYLGRTDYVYPYLTGSQFETNTVSKAHNLPDAAALTQVLNAHPQTLILGTRESLELTFKENETAANMWNSLKEGSSESWDGEWEEGLLLFTPTRRF